MQHLSISILLSLVVLGCRSGDKNTIDTAVPSSDTVDADGDGYDSTEDCDDNNSVVSPAAEEICDGIDNNCDGSVDEGVTSTYYVDSDGDGFGDPGGAAESCDEPSGYVLVGNDCDDSDADSYPGAPERCDGVDNDCDTLVDEDVTTTFYADADADGYGDAAAAVEDCDPETGYVSDGTDCDDTDADSYPGAAEVCDEADNDCDGTVDEDVTTTFYADADGDEYGVADNTTEACSLPTGYAADPGDCDDTTTAISPAEAEVCNDIDDNCDGTVDEGVTSTFYADDDADGYGDAKDRTDACTQPTGFVSDDTDCDDAEPAANPGEAEVCDDIDNDCDGTIDEDDATDASTWYADDDSDGFGDAGDTTDACTQPTGFVSDDTDCDDSDAAINPDGEEVCDSADNDCDGTVDEDDATDAATWYTDDDSDGFGDATNSTEACTQPSGTVSDDTDCDDSDADINPDGEEVCDSADNDCDGSIDEDDATDALTWYADDDGDGFGDVSDTTESCAQPTGYTSDSDDCDDTDADISPDGEEVCDGADNDCDGTVDEDDASDALTWYADDDGDGFGDVGDSTEACVQPTGFVSDDTDCDDGDAAISPGEEEVWYDGVDSDCGGDNDYDADGDGDESADEGSGDDCDDEDASRYGGEGCRPEVSCTHPSAATLTSYDPSGVSDIVFDGDCDAYVSTVISGTDYIYVIDSSGSTSTITGYSNYNIQSLAFDPGSSDIAVSHNDNSRAGIGISSSGARITNAVSSTYNNSSLWSNTYMNRSQASLVWDSDGYIWAINFSGSGSLSSVTSSGTTSSLFTGLSHIESVALDSDEDLYISIGDTIYTVNKTSGARASYYVAGDDVLDMIFDYNDDLYVETDGGDIELVPGDGSAASVYDTVSGQGHLAISPDGWLVRVIPNPLSSASYEEWELGD